MHWLRNSNVNMVAVFIAVIGLTLSNASYSTENIKNNKVTNKIESFSIPHTSSTIKIDGELDDPLWQQALSISLNIVNDPWNNLPSPVKTEAKIIENGEYIYISFLAQDPNPANIIGFLADRDSTLADDIVGIKLDTFNSRRLNYAFFVNPFGVQNDSIQNEITGENNLLWDGIWQSYGKITANGYQVEMAIPFRTLNFEQSDKEKTWAMELFRMYPRDERLRISHMPISRDNGCWVCQMPEVKGFKSAKIGKNITLTPAVVATRNETRDIYAPNDPFKGDNNVDVSMDLRWGITPSTLLNATINPDFSTVESDAGQLSVNTTFSLFYDEKRTFFLENADYFSSNYNLVYTRNIAQPDYGVKLTSRKKNHSYGVFVTNDKQTNFIVPGNTGSSLATLKQKSTSAAANYRYNVNNNVSVGVISTLRSSDNYHNIVGGVDGKYRLDGSNSFLAQALYSNTQYPDELFQDFCYGDDCSTPPTKDCIFAACDFTEQVHRTRYEDDFSGQAYKVEFKHDSEYWLIKASHQELSSNFRADLGFMPKADYKKDMAKATRFIYGEDDDIFSEIRASTSWNSEHNENNEFIGKTLSADVSIFGPMLSEINVIYKKATKIGLRQNEANIKIDGNSDRFKESLLSVNGQLNLTPRVLLFAGTILGDKIDYANNRLGKYQEYSAFTTINATDHLLFDIYVQKQKLKANGSYVYDANLADIRISYQFDVRSYLKLNIVYSDVDRNINNNPFTFVNNKERSLSTQLIYSYKLNPQTVFFVGYSDSSYQDDDLSNLKLEQRTFFTKISYAWMP